MMRRRNKILLGLAGAAALLALGIWLGPRMLGLFYQVRGGLLLEQASRPEGEEQAALFACMQEPISDPERVRQLEQAIGYLEKAVQVDASLAQAYLLMGRGWCLGGEYKEAADSYRIYTRLRTQNPLGLLESGIAYSVLCSSLYPSNIDMINSLACGESGFNRLISERFKAAGLRTRQLYDEGQSAFFEQAFVEAALWLHLFANVADEMQQSELFIYALADILTDRQPQTVQAIQIWSVPNSESGTQIPGSDLLWTRPGEALGKPLSAYPGGGVDSGVMWWSGVAIAIIDVPTSGNYLLEVQIQDVPPAPVEVQIECDFKPQLKIVLEQGNKAWREYATACYLERGLNIVGIRFLNDGMVGNLNRNAVIGWIRVNAK